VSCVLAIAQSKPTRRTLAAVALVVALGLAGVSSAGSSIPQQGPRNPEFEQYLEDLRFGRRPAGATEDGHTLGFIPPPMDLSHLRGRESQALGPQSITGHPAVYDLRTSGPGGTAEVTAVYDQGWCGSCWAFGTLASLESWLLKVQGETWDLSENNLKECHGFDFTPCEGGNGYMTTAYLSRRSGPVLEGDDPYFPFTTGCSGEQDVPLYLRETAIPASEDRIKTLLQSHGAMATSFYWDASYFDSETNTYYYDGAQGTNHCVALVGWDDAKVVPGAPSAGAWIYKNSWGTDWGEDGYFYLSYDDTHAARYTHLFFDARDADDTRIYEYDPLGWVTELGYGDADDWAANVFTAAHPGDLQAVGFYTTDVSVDYWIYVKRGEPDGAVAYDQGGWLTETDAGYHTVDLAAPVSLSSGETFTVVIRFRGDVSYRWVIAVEYALGMPEIGWDYSMGATANVGESYMSNSGTPGSWDDLTNWDSTANLCIKAIVQNEPPPAAVTDFNATDGEDQQSTLSWTNPADGDLAQVVVQRATGGYPADHTDGTTIYSDESPTAGAPIAGVVDGSLANGTTYYYAVFSCDTLGAWNDTVSVGRSADAATPDAPLKGHWALDEAGGMTAGDSSGYGNDGMIVGAIRAAGSPDGSTALSCDGVGDYAWVPHHASLDFAGEFTVEAWIKSGDLSGFKAIVVKRGSLSEALYGLFTNNDKLQCYVINYNRSSLTALTGDTSLSTGVWYHVALRRDAVGEISLWVDGVKEAATGIVTGLVNPPGDLYIGRHSTATQQDLAGMIDEVRIHGEALDPSGFNLTPAVDDPPALVTNFNASDGEDQQSTLSWTNPGDSDLKTVVVLRKEGSYPSGHSDGAAVAVVNDTNPTEGGPGSYTDTGRTNGTKYYYAVFAEDDASQWNDTVTPGSNADTGTPAEPGATTPIGYWRFDGSGSTATDESTYGNDGMIVGAIRAAGSPDGSTALSCDGVGDYAWVPHHASLDFAGEFTVEAWIKSGDLSGFKAIVVKRGSLSEALYGLFTNNDKLQCYVINYNRSSLTALTGDTSLSTGVWYHVALRRDAVGEISLWVDGVKEAATGIVTGLVNPPGDLYIGRHSTATQQDLAGMIDEVRIHGEALDPSGFNLTTSLEAAVQRASPHDTGVSPIARVRPNPVSGSDIAIFEVLGADVMRLRVKVWNLAGECLHDSGWENGYHMSWDPRGERAEPLAAGVYIYWMAAETASGATLSFPLQKLFVTH